ncbi:hypothetical protein HDU83_008620 [Entophlyctis luteolus]|nr:hypothetical protein HDU82_008037 [Entophlyctis luteolus]KAJ3357113.1 hypothetical protein HDU83_008620 [Entophlyctis luteolus]
MHCGIFCQSLYSPTVNGINPCFSSTDRFGKTCISGKYTFDSNTWVINSDAFNGDPYTADWVVDPLGLDNGNMRFGANGGFMASITKTPTGWVLQDSTNPNSYPAGLGIRLTSTAWIQYGAWEARLLTAQVVGAVTAFIAFAEDRDEIDWENTRSTTDTFSPNYFSLGNNGLLSGNNYKALPIGYDPAQDYVTIRVEWTTDQITWFINGEQGAVITKAETCDSSGNNCAYPNSPSRIQFALWDGGAGAAGTRTWAGGYIPWGDDATATIGFNSTVQYISIQCNGDSAPTGPPTRKSGYGAPSLMEPPISVAVPGLSGYSATLNTRKTSAYVS